MSDNFDVQQKHAILIILILVALILGIYWPVQDYGFINFDDDVYVTQNINVQSDITRDGLCWAFSTKYFGLWNPLTWLSLMLDYQLFGLNAGGYHWTNVIFHILNSVLLFFLFKNLTGAVWRSALVAALFAVHPMNVESVAWIAERKNVLSTFFWFLTMLFYVRYAKHPDWKRYLPVLICFALGLMSKPMLVTVPFVLLLLDYWPLNRTMIHAGNAAETSRDIKAEKEKISFLLIEKIPLLGLSAISIYITISTPNIDKTIYTTFADRICNTVFSYVMYLQKLFLPTDLSIYYVYLAIPSWKIFVSTALLILFTIFVCKHFKKHPYLPVGWFWYLGTLVPVIGLIQIADHTMADRYAYVPAVGIFIMIAWGAEKICSTPFRKNLFIGIAVLCIAILAIAGHHQVKLWASTVTLFENALKKNPDNHIAYQIIGQEMARNGENEKALNYFDIALKIRPYFYPAYNNKAAVFQKMGKRDEALQNFEMSARINKFSAETYFSIGLIYLEDGKFDKSIEYALKAIKIKPDYQPAYDIAGIAFVEKGKPEEGIRYFEKSLRLNPQSINAQKNLRIALEKSKKLN